MTADGWAECSLCGFPARKSAIDEVLQVQNHCPMCQGSVQAGDFKSVR